MTMFEAQNLVSQALQHKLNPATAVKRWVVGLSGGLDSCVLLHALAKANLSQPILACHIHHGLSSSADAWQSHCEDLCQQLGVSFVARSVDLTASGKGLEDAARQARYQAFEEVLEPGDCLLLAHHRDDQAETLLLRLMRGAGPKGLGAMPERRSIGAAILVRPLLGLPRSGLENYARAHQLSWVEDDSNSDESLDRNYLRQQVMPLLEARWPEFSRNWQASAELCRRESALTEALARDDLALVDPEQDRAGASVSLPALQQLEQGRLQLLLRVWCDRLGVPALNRSQLAQIEEQLIQHRQDSAAEVQWAGYSMRCYQQRLYLYPTPATPVLEGRLHWDLTDSLSLGGSTQLLAGQGDVGLQAGLEYRVCYRSGGERCKPLGRNHSQTLKKLLQEYSLPPWLRDRVPLIYLGDQLVAVGDLWICDGYAVEDGVTLSWQTGLTLDSQAPDISRSSQDLD